jgi:hypothetical protein
MILRVAMISLCEVPANHLVLNEYTKNTTQIETVTYSHNHTVYAILMKTPAGPKPYQNFNVKSKQYFAYTLFWLKKSTHSDLYQHLNHRLFMFIPFSMICFH